MPSCPKCGKEVPADAVYCPHCAWKGIYTPLASSPTPPPTPTKKKAIKLQKILGATISVIIFVMVISVIAYKYAPTLMPTPTSKPTPDTNALDAVIAQIEVEKDRGRDALDVKDYGTAYRITYEMERLLGNAMKEYSAIAERLALGMSYGYKIYFGYMDAEIKRIRLVADWYALEDLLSQSREDPELLPQVGFALVSYGNLIPDHRQTLDTLQRLYEQDPETAEAWGLTPSFLSGYKKWIAMMESDLDRYHNEYENVKTRYKEYASIEQKNIEASSEVRDRLMALCRTTSAEGIIPFDLALFFDKFDLNGDGKMSLNEGQEFFAWVEANIKYRYDDEYDPEGFSAKVSGLITQEELGDDRPGDEYWQKPYETFKEGYGDCEDMAILEAAFLQLLWRGSLRGGCKRGGAWNR
ncbi:MAG: zinc-ribbon domain-containing protein [Nitrososphaerota archaeon]|nr:zinc-ribbon domain-containing protein [Nitrososphaerota archaeon]